MLSRLLPGRRPGAALLVPLLVILTLGIAACEPREAGVMLVTVAGTTAPNTSGERTWLDFKRDVEARSGGTMLIRPLIYGQVGSEEQLLSGLRRGRIHFANLSAQLVSTLVPELALLYAPYLFSDGAEADYVYDTYLTGVFREILAEHDLHLITWYEIGFSQVYGRQPILVPENVRGVRFRVSSALSARLFAESLGADVIPLGYTEIVSALQTGLVEAGENSVSLYARTGIAGEAPHLTLTNHSLGVSVIVTELNWWNSLSEEQRRTLSESFPPIEETRQSVRAESAADVAQADELGIIVHPLSAEQLAAWQAATVPVTERLIRALGGRSAEIHEGILDARARWRDRVRQAAEGSSTAMPVSRPLRRSGSASPTSSSG